MFQWLTTSQAGHLLLTLLISAVPVIELRGGIPYGIALGANPWLVFAASVIGNMLPVPFILLFIRKILRWMKRYPRLGRIANKLESRAARKSAGVRKSELIGLCILVALPLPGTGAWTGALVAALMEMRLKTGHPDHLRRCPDCGNPGNAGVHRCESAAFSGINETEEAQNEKARLYLLG